MILTQVDWDCLLMILILETTSEKVQFERTSGLIIDESDEFKMIMINDKNRFIFKHHAFKFRWNDKKEVVNQSIFFDNSYSVHCGYTITSPQSFLTSLAVGRKSISINMQVHTILNWSLICLSLFRPLWKDNLIFDVTGFTYEIFDYLTPFWSSSLLLWLVSLCCLRLAWSCALCSLMCFRLRYTSAWTCWLCTESLTNTPASLPSTLYLPCLSTAWVTFSVRQ